VDIIAYMYSTFPSNLATKYGSPLPTRSILGSPDAPWKEKITSKNVAMFKLMSFCSKWI